MDMSESFAEMLNEDGHKNSLGRVNEVIDLVLAERSRLEELFNAMLHEDAWVRMRAADAFEKICRQHPEWVRLYLDRIQSELSTSDQPSIQWHIAQIYTQVKLNEHQKKHAISWLTKLLGTRNVDWIVAANSMKTLADFVVKGDIERSNLIPLLKIQLNHKSNAVVKRANKLLTEFS